MLKNININVSNEELFFENYKNEIECDQIYHKAVQVLLNLITSTPDRIWSPFNTQRMVLLNNTCNVLNVQLETTPCLIAYYELRCCCSLKISHRIVMFITPGSWSL